MKGFPKSVITKLALIACLTLLFVTVPVFAGAMQTGGERWITEWEVKWADSPDLAAVPGSVTASEGWSPNPSGMALPKRPGTSSTLWIRTKLPALNWDIPSMLIPKIYGQNIAIFIGTTPIYESNRDYIYDNNKVLTPLQRNDSDKILYIGVQSAKDRIGLRHGIELGNYPELLDNYVKRDLIDIILGCAFVFIALVMLICSVFLKKEQNASWISLSLVIASAGVLVITYSPFLYTFYKDYGKLYTRLWDVALFVLLPSLTYFIERIFGSGYRSVIKKLLYFQIGYSAFCLLFMLANIVLNDKLFGIHYFLSVRVLGIVMIVQAVLLVSNSIIHAVKGNRSAEILTVGFAVFGLTVIGEMVWFYLKDGNYDLFLWKWGAAVFIISLMLILGRNYTINHEQIVKYSKELEMFNNELQRSEKMAIISELAASVAHEVRNPLQVTRGFLQVLTKKYRNQDKIYMTMALEELDRAAGIITDFLTFAKPQFERISVLNVKEELGHVEGVIVPLANLQGAQIDMRIPDHLQVKGNSSKFKQAFINMVKNSIEALSGDGQINVWAYEMDERVVIHIQDNGEGMSKEELARLGEPYFSNKTKGTGLGLMVTFRIVEAMGGSLEFKSEKGVGTEAVVSFPSAAV